MSKENRIKELETKREKYYALVDAIIELHDSGLGDNTTASTLDYANSKVMQIFGGIEEIEDSEA